MSYNISNDTLIENDYFNDTIDVDPKLMERYLTNKGIDEPAYTTIIVLYCCLIVLGASGNTLVVSNKHFLSYLVCNTETSILI